MFTPEQQQRLGVDARGDAEVGRQPEDVAAQRTPLARCREAEVELVYFDILARGELVRLCYAAHGPSRPKTKQP